MLWLEDLERWWKGVSTLNLVEYLKQMVTELVGQLLVKGFLDIHLYNEVDVLRRSKAITHTRVFKSYSEIVRRLYATLHDNLDTLVGRVDNMTERLEDESAKPIPNVAKEPDQPDLSPNKVSNHFSLPFRTRLTAHKDEQVTLHDCQPVV